MEGYVLGRRMAEDREAIVETCKAFVRSMYATEEAIGQMDESLSAEEIRDALEEVLRWIQETEEVPEGAFTREVAREIVGQLSGILVLKGYQGSTDTYIG